MAEAGAGADRQDDRSRAGGRIQVSDEAVGDLDQAEVAQDLAKRWSVRSWWFDWLAGNVCH